MHQSNLSETLPLTSIEVASAEILEFIDQLHAITLVDTPLILNSNDNRFQIRITTFELPEDYPPGRQYKVEINENIALFNSLVPGDTNLSSGTLILGTNAATCELLQLSLNDLELLSDDPDLKGNQFDSAINAFNHFVANILKERTYTINLSTFTDFYKSERFSILKNSKYALSLHEINGISSPCTLKGFDNLEYTISINTTCENWQVTLETPDETISFSYLPGSDLIICSSSKRHILENFLINLPTEFFDSKNSL